MNSSKTRVIEYIPIYILMCLILYINPTLALILSFMVLFATRNESKGYYFLFFIMLSLWLGLINSTKELASDQIAYATWYENVNDAEILNSILNYRGHDWGLREPIFNIYSVFLHVLLHGNIPAYFIAITLTIYFLHFISLFKICKHLSLSKSVIISAVLITAFFQPMFVQSVHAVRQMLAASFLIYAVTTQLTTQKINWPFLVMACLTHSSTILYIGLLFVPFIYKQFKWKYLYLIILFFFIFVLLAPTIGRFMILTDSDTFSYVGSYMTKSSSDDTSQLTLWNMNIYCIPLLIVSIISFSNHSNNTIKYPYLYMFIITYLICLSFEQIPILRVRYFMYVGSLISYIVIMFNHDNPRITELMSKWAAVVVIILFIYMGLGSQYASMSTIVSSSLDSFLST